MRQINQNILKIKDPTTGEFKTIPNLMLDNDPEKISGVEVGTTEPTDIYTDVWIDTNEDVSYKIPQIDDNAVNTVDTWSSMKISREIDGVNEKVNELESSKFEVNSSIAQMPISASWSSVAYGNGIYIAIANEDNTANIAYSNNGIEWSIVPLQESKHWNSITYGNGKFVIISSEGTAICSEDGITWNYAILPHLSEEEVVNWVSVAYGNGKFVACYYYYSGSVFNSYINRSVYSDDGIIWENGKSGYTTDGRSTCLIYGNNKFVTLLTNGSIWHSETGVSFDSNLESGLPESYDRISYGNGTFVACSSYIEDKIYYSKDGLTWTASNNNGYNHFSSITYGNGQFIAIDSDSSEVIYSQDAITWFNSTLVNDGVYEAVVYDGEKFIAIAKDSLDVILSNNGVMWDTKYHYLTQNEENVTNQVHEALNINKNYCLGEVKTGDTWIDGKPIYRFIWQGTTSLKDGQGVVCQLPEGHFDTVFTLRGMFKRTTDNNWFSIPNIYYGGVDWAVNIRTNMQTDIPDQILVGFGAKYTDTNRPIIIFAEYTKQ